ncbi:MAG: conjugal transfer protein TrbL [Salinibacterium sp.]|nr:conjugal transfer protein TrbL [Salinibacterium sp.]
MSVCDVPVISDVCAAAGEGAATLVTAPFEWLANAVGATAGWLFQTVWTLIDQTTLVDLGNPAYQSVYSLVFGIAVIVTVIFFLAQLITGMIRRDPGALARAATGSAKSVLGAFLVIGLATTLLEVTDQLTVGIVQAAGMTMSEMGVRIGALFAGLATISIASPGVGVIVTLFLGFLAIAGTATVWFSLLIRKALLLVAIVLAPLALAGASWDATRGWVGKWAASVLALIVSKFVVVLVFLVAVVQMDAPIDLDLQSVADPLAGVVLLLVAAFAPYLVYKLISFVGFDMYHAISTEQEAKQAMNRPLPLPTSPSASGIAKSVLGGTPAPPSGSAPGGATASTGTAGAGAATGGSAVAGRAGGGAAAGGAAAAAGPAAAAVIGAQIVTGAAEAGPRAGATVAGATDAHAGAATQTPPSPAPPTRGAPPAVPPPAPPKTGDAP